MQNLSKRLEALEIQATQDQTSNHTVFGFVCPQKGFTHAISNEGGYWHETDDEPDVYLAAKLEPVVTTTKRYVILIGGRGSSKSLAGAAICLADAKDTGAKTFFLREFQTSIQDSVHSLLKDEIPRLGFEGFQVQDRKILYNGKNVFSFAGIARNHDSIKSAHGFKRFAVEESQFISEESLRALTPTARKKPKKGLPSEMEEVMDKSLDNVSLLFIANPGSSEDPFSKRFITPFQQHLERDGFYEDDLHLIVELNFLDNPWFAQSGLEKERAWDEEHLPAALYEHIWLGNFNDSVENALVMAEWFDACIDAHLKIGFKPLGLRMAAHDPSDLGGDAKGMATRHGSVVTGLWLMPSGDVNEGGDWAANLALGNGVDTFTWDCDGMGVALNRQFATAFHGKQIAVSMFKGSEIPDTPEALFNPSSLTSISNQKTWKEVCRNKRAQYYLKLRERIYNTYRMVKYGDHSDVENLISFDSSLEYLKQLRSELCRMPIKPNNNGLFELYTKPDMRSKFGLASPNLADSVMMLMRTTSIVQPGTAYKLPKPLKTMGR
jgi:phage terminase large subunit